jgi:diguanylate cyclase (GGDEF)-like protein
MPMPVDTLKILEMLPLIYEDLDIDSIEQRFFEQIRKLFTFDRLALFFIKHHKGLLHGKLSYGFASGEVEALDIPLPEDYIRISPQITASLAWNQIIDRDPCVKSLGLANFAVIPIINRKRVLCWEFNLCKEPQCPAFGNRWLRCWLIPNHKCCTGQNLTPKQKLKKCEACPVYLEGHNDYVEGVLLVDNTASGTAISERVILALSLIGRTVGTAINHAKRFDRTLSLSINDDLTGIKNRRYFNERLKEELVRVSRYPDNPLSLIMGDIDFFKKVNDNHGHQAGDSVLIWFAKLLSSELRKSDLVARYGGEEFTILLINTVQDLALEVAEHLRQQIESTSISATGIPITASFGVATFGQDANSVESLMGKVDKALYTAKAQGRNRVCSAD